MKEKEAKFAQEELDRKLKEETIDVTLPSVIPRYFQFPLLDSVIVHNVGIYLRLPLQFFWLILHKINKFRWYHDQFVTLLLPHSTLLFLWIFIYFCAILS